MNLSWSTGVARQAGLTLLELLITLAVFILLTTLATPSVQSLLESTERRSTLLAVYQGLMFARQEAVRRNSSVTLCPLDKSGRCHGDWNQPVAVFMDPDNQRALADETHLLRVIPPPRNGHRRVGVGNQGYFHYGPLGAGVHTPGHVLYCPGSGDARQAGQLIINMAGRVRFARDHNGDGVVQDAHGNPMDCS